MVGGSRKKSVLLTFSTVFILTKWVGGSKKVQNLADVIYEWSLSQIVEGSCGVVTPNTECKIVDVSTGDNLPPHKTGELCVRGKVGTVRPLDARFLGLEKNRVAQNWYNLNYLIGRWQNYQKIA